jgi:hypothetical protein
VLPGHQPWIRLPGESRAFLFPIFPKSRIFRAVKTLRLTLSLLICVPLGAVCGGLYAFHASPTSGVYGGAFIGLVMGPAFGGVESVATFLYGSEVPEEWSDENWDR